MICPLCKDPNAEWYTTFRASYCKKCWREYHRRWKQNHRERHLEISKVCWDKNKDEYNLDRKLGGPTLYEILYNKQNGLCAICNQPETSKRYKTLSVDHCHNTNVIRGLLCSTCNRGLGLLKDNVDILNSAIKYLEKNHE